VEVLCQIGWFSIFSIFFYNLAHNIPLKKSKITITPLPDSVGKYLEKTWKFRSLIIAFAQKDIQVKFSQTFLRFSWAIIQPVVGTLVFAFFFGYILHWKTGNLPFPVYVISGLISWSLFTNVVIHGSNSIHESSVLIRKIYFPKLIMPLSKILVAMFELVISFLLLVLMMIYYEITPSWHLIFLPLVLLLNILFALSLVFLLSAFSYRNKDLLHLIPFISYFGIWLTPVFFTNETLPESLRFLWYINPMAGIVDGWRFCLFNDWRFNLQYLPALLTILPLALISLVIYTKQENKFSDYI
jgi:lipopolysaccharide transport system permease protein